MLNVNRNTANRMINQAQAARYSDPSFLQALYLISKGEPEGT